MRPSSPRSFFQLFGPDKVQVYEVLFEPGKLEDGVFPSATLVAGIGHHRSEERRVGKECPV